jgi:hypothetical protein
MEAVAPVLLPKHIACVRLDTLANVAARRKLLSSKVCSAESSNQRSSVSTANGVRALARPSWTCRWVGMRASALGRRCATVTVMPCADFPPKTGKSNVARTLNECLAHFVTPEPIEDFKCEKCRRADVEKQISGESQHW